MKTIIHRIRSYKRVAWTTTLCADGVVRGLVLELDASELLDQLGGKAKHNKSGKAQIARGALRVRVEEL